MMCLDDKFVLFVYGEGGHTAQMARLAPNLLNKLKGFNAITLSDSSKKASWSFSHIVTGEFRNKHKWVGMFTNLGPLSIFIESYRLIQKYNIRVIITTGPGIAISAALAGRILGAKIIHIETWSRFTSSSLSGRIMYLLASKFYVQNESLLQLYPKAIFSGRL